MLSIAVTPVDPNLLVTDVDLVDDMTLVVLGRRAPRARPRAGLARPDL